MKHFLQSYITKFRKGYTEFKKIYKTLRIFEVLCVMIILVEIKIYLTKFIKINVSAK